LQIAEAGFCVLSAAEPAVSTVKALNWTGWCFTSWCV